MANIVELSTKRIKDAQRLNDQRVAEFEAVVEQILGQSKAA